MPDTTLIDRVQEFLDIIEKDEHHSYEFRSDESNMMVRLMWADVQMLVAIAKSVDGKAGPREFLVAAERAVAGWKRANTNQITTIGRLQDNLRLLRIENKEALRIAQEAEDAKRRLAIENTNLEQQVVTLTELVAE